MKRARFIIPVALCIVLLAIITTGLIGDDPHVPRFVPVQPQPTGPYSYMDYGWGDFAPVREGKMWFWAVPVGTNRHAQQFLYDLKNRRVVGELLNANPVFANRDQTKLLCEGYSASEALKWKLIRWLEKFSLGKGLRGKLKYEEAFWILDLRNNSAVRVGKFSQLAGSGSRFVPSPGFRYGYNEPSTAREGVLFLCDLESNLFAKVTIGGETCEAWGWWDERNILFRGPANNLCLFDVVTRKTNTIITSAAISNSLQELNLPDDTTDITAICHWNGKENDILLTKSSEKNWGECFLLEVDRKDLSIKLLHRDFKFQWSGHFDADLTRYVFQGESGQAGSGGNGGVYLRNLTNNTTVTLVEPDNGGQYSLVRFCDDGVIYWRKKHLWRVDLDGSNNVPLIPGSPR